MSLDLSILTYTKKGMVGVDPELKNLLGEDCNASKSLLDNDCNARALAGTGKMLDNNVESLLLKSPDPENRTKYGIYQSIISLA